MPNEFGKILLWSSWDFFLSRPCIFRAVTWNSANIHTEKRESDSPTGREKHGRLPRSFFYPLLLYSIHTRCSFPYFHGVSKYYRVHESCLDRGEAILSSCEWDSAEPARASLFWVIFFKDMNLAVWLTLNIAWNWSHKMWNWIQYSFLYCNTNTSNR